MFEENRRRHSRANNLQHKRAATKHDGTGENLEFARSAAEFIKPYYAAMVEMVQKPAELTRLRMP